MFSRFLFSTLQPSMSNATANLFFDWQAKICCTVFTSAYFHYFLVGDAHINKKIHEQLDTLLDIEVIDGTILCDWLFDALEQQRFLEQFQMWNGKFIVFSSKHINPILATRLNRIAYELNIP